MTHWPTYPTPEEAAWAGWVHTPDAAARVVEIRPHADGGDAVRVVVQLGEATGFHDQDIVTCIREDDGRWTSAGSTGASSG